MTRILISLICCIFLFTACPEPTTPPEIADCDLGYHPCGKDSTECCLDTTSHEVSWVIDTLGRTDGFNWLYDVAVIDENNVWVVGEIQMGDSMYNAAQWDGSEWNNINIGPPKYAAAYPHNAVFAFSSDDIWTATSAAYHWNGNEWEAFGTSNSTWEFDGYVKRIWGSSSNNLFFVGEGGTIVYYDGSEFTMMESGTDIHLESITGTGPDNVWISGYNESDIRTVLLHYDGNTLRKVLEGESFVDDYHDGISGRIMGVFTDDPDSIWVVTQKGLYRCAKDTEGEGFWYGEDSDPTSKIETVRGNRHNDIYYGVTSPVYGTITDQLFRLISFRIWVPSMGFRPLPNWWLRSV